MVTCPLNMGLMLDIRTENKYNLRMSREYFCLSNSKSEFNVAGRNPSRHLSPQPLIATPHRVFFLMILSRYFISRVLGKVRYCCAAGYVECCKDTEWFRALQA